MARTGVDPYVLHASSAETATGTGTIQLNDMGGYSAIWFECDLTAAATESGDTFDLYVQACGPGGNWVDVVHFTQMLGNGGAKRFEAKITAGIAETMFETGTALGAAAVRNLLGSSYRCRWAITDATTAGNASFTFSLTANAIGT